MSRTKAVAGAAAAACLAFGAGCAGNQPVPAASIEQAAQRIDEAERAEAQRYANRELNMAREKLIQAREAQEDGDEERAARLAEHAELDAAYAIALADNESVQAAVDELRATLSTLESELQRQQGDQLGTPPEDGDIDVSLRDDGIADPAVEPGDLAPLDNEPIGPDPLETDPLEIDPLGPDAPSAPDDAVRGPGL